MNYGKVVIVDLENTCWEPREEQGDQPSEVIEIGVCVLDTKTLDISRKHSYIIKPKLSKISEFCTKLTGHTWKSVKSGMQFDHACNKLAKEYGTKNKVWVSWGDGDRLHMEKECADKKTKYPFGPTHINLSAVYNIFMGSTVNFSVERALDKLGIGFIGKPHCGADDAYNTAMILKNLIVNVKNWLMGANKMPSLKIFRKCTRHIYEMKKYEKDENGQPSDKDDHMPENIYRYSLTGIVWTDINLFNQRVEFPVTAVA